VQLRSGIATNRPGAVMLELRSYPISGCFRRAVSAESSLDEMLHLVERYPNTFPMCLANAFISSHKRR
jgi:hypothetical protein